MQRLSRRGFLAGVGASAAVAASTTPAAASTGGPSRADPAVAAEEILDELVPASLEEHGVPGATVALVDGDRTVTKGYGIASEASGSPVDPAETAFRVGSVSKTVTATALMDRVQQGSIDPTVPVSEYVEDAIAPDRPATLAELVTHRGGFESSNRGLWLPSPDSLRPLSAYLRAEPQQQVRDPGTVGAYSNFGAALAGQVLAATTDQPFASAIDEALLKPAGMTASSFRQPLPDGVAASHAAAHGAAGAQSPGEFPLVGLRPAGSLSATADDMARFLELHLHGGAIDGEQVLEPGTVGAMHEQWATHHGRLDGMGLGLIEERRGDTRTLWHNGATPSFYSHLVIAPEAEFGLFVSFNAPAGSTAANDVVGGVLDEMLPEPEPEPRSPDGRPTRADELTGTYRALKQSYTWHDRATSVLNAPTVTVSVAEDGALRTESGGSTVRWVEIEPLVFERESGGGRIAFGGDDGISYLFRGGSPTAYGRVTGADRLRLHGLLLLCTTLGVLSGMFGWPATTVLDWLRDDAPGGGEIAWRSLLTSRPARAKLLAIGAAAVAVGGVVLMVLHLGLSPYLVLSDPPTTFRLLFAGPLLGLAGTVGSLGYAARLWLSGDGSPLGRVHYTVVAASLVGLCWQLRYWNLLFPPA